MASFVERVCCGGWLTRWSPSEEVKSHYPPRHTDFRDSAPESLAAVQELYQPMVHDGRWTHGLIEMWFPKNKPVKHSVHIPCWDSFRWNPLKWRGICLGRTVEECYWTGLRQTRWARAIYAANLGREYVMPVRNIGRHGYKSDIKALCWMYFLMGCIFSCGIGQAATCCGSNLLINCSAWYSCHARERMRRRYKLPPTFFMPPGIDDCLVHFFCFYCASHQEMRELAVRGVDGPGMHILDVLPNSFNQAEGIDEAKSQRKKVLAHMLAKPPKMFRSRVSQEGGLRQKVADVAVSIAAKSPLEGSDETGTEAGSLTKMPVQEGEESEASSIATDDELGTGWARPQYRAPAEQAMRRSGDSGGSAERSVTAARVATSASADAADASTAPPPGGPEPLRWSRQYSGEVSSTSAIRDGYNPWQGGPQLRRLSERMVPVIREGGPGGSAADHQSDGELRVVERAWSVAY